MDKRQIELHVTILGWIYVITGFLALFLGVLVFSLLVGGVTAFIDDPLAVRMVSIAGFSMASLMAVLSLPSLVAGYGLLTHRAWARGLALVVGVLRMIDIPIGTLIGVYTLWVLLQNESQEYFALRAA